MDDGSASIASRTRKKRKLEETEGALPAEAIDVGSHHEDFWFTDGSVVIVAENQAFKVHSTLLSRHSAVFEERFDELHALEAPEIYEDCPVLRVEDEEDKLALLLDTIYDGGKRLSWILVHCNGANRLPVVTSFTSTTGLSTSATCATSARLPKSTRWTRSSTPS